MQINTIHDYEIISIIPVNIVEWMQEQGNNMRAEKKCN